MCFRTQRIRTRHGVLLVLHRGETVTSLSLFCCFVFFLFLGLPCAHNSLLVTLCLGCHAQLPLNIIPRNGDVLKGKKKHCFFFFVN